MLPVCACFAPNVANILIMLVVQLAKHVLLEHFQQAVTHLQLQHALFAILANLMQCKDPLFVKIAVPIPTISNKDKLHAPSAMMLATQSQALELLLVPFHYPIFALLDFFK